jgi:hypothetical protein
MQCYDYGPRKHRETWRGLIMNKTTTFWIQTHLFHERKAVDVHRVADRGLER